MGISRYTTVYVAVEEANDQAAADRNRARCELANLHLRDLVEEHILADFEDDWDGETGEPDDTPIPEPVVTQAARTEIEKLRANILNTLTWEGDSLMWESWPFTRDADEPDPTPEVENDIDAWWERCKANIENAIRNTT